MDKEESRNRKRAIIATVSLHALALAALLLCRLHYSFEPIDETPAGSGNSFYGGEYVMLGQEAAQAAESGSPAAPEALPETAEEAQSPEMLSSDSDSPMKVKEQSETARPTAEELAEQERLRAEQERLRAEQETRQRTNSKVKNAFSRNGSGNSGSSPGSPDGNSDSGTRQGAPGISGLNGYTLDSWGRPSSPVEGKVVIKVRVNARGKVISAAYDSGSGSAAGDLAVRRSCEQAALQSSFSVPVGTADEAVGYITWIFE